MKEPLIWKIREKISKVIRFFTGHKYGCCDDIFKRCRKCPLRWIQALLYGKENQNVND